jgi:hypothetical protein
MSLGLISLEYTQQISFYWVRLLAPRPTPNLEDQVSVFTPPETMLPSNILRALGSSGTSGSPFPVPTYVGPWGASENVLN